MPSDRTIAIQSKLDANADYIHLMECYPTDYGVYSHQRAGHIDVFSLTAATRGSDEYAVKNRETGHSEKTDYWTAMSILASAAHNVALNRRRLFG